MKNMINIDGYMVEEEAYVRFLEYEASVEDPVSFEEYFHFK